jgi:DNA repair exonuclease SbcCD nuclease subunit
MRFIHTSDWQLGKPFGRMLPDARAALQEARLDVIDTIAKLARSEAAPLVLVAGDVFDSPEPGDRIFRQALGRMKAVSDVRWHLLPGNHDPARADGLWSRLLGEAPDNVSVSLTPEPVQLDDTAWLLPAPLQHKRALSDPTAWFDSALTPAGAHRIGLAHGGITSFTTSSDTANLIAPDRATRAGLSYLALGDWHGHRAINAMTRYSGTPEPDDFGREETGMVLVVNLQALSAAPDVTAHQTNRYHWAQCDWTLTSAEDLDLHLRALAPGVARNNLVARIKLSGLLSLAERVQVRISLETELANEMRWLDLQLGDLYVRPTDTDLAEIDAHGVLRAAADKLRAMASESGPAARQAGMALERLYLEQQKTQRLVEE